MTFLTYTTKAFINLSLPCILLIALACNSPSSNQEDLIKKEQELLQKENELLKKENDLLKKEQELKAAQTEAKEEKPEKSSPIATSEPTEKPIVDHPIRLGKHNITLQWISWDHPGTVNVSNQGDGSYKITGGQQSKENDDYLTIDGSIQFDTEKSFVFQGELEYRVSHNNGGEPCIKTGPLHFRATGSRKYWRMKEKTNCEGGMLTDYVDIYF